MKITFVLPEANLSGGIRVVSIYADRLMKRGHEVVAISIPPRRPSWREIARSVMHGRGLPTWGLSQPSHFDPLAVEHRVIRHSGPVTDRDVPDADLVVATWWETAEWVWALSPRKGVKVHFMQDYEIWGGHVPRVDATCRLPMPKIVIARWVWELLEKRFGQRPVALIPNRVEQDRFFAPERDKQAIPTIGFTYATMRNKGTDLAIAAITQARKALPTLAVISFGSCKPIDGLELPPHTRYVEKAPDSQLRNLYAACDAWLFSTRVEGFGLPVLEAMACRTPVIGMSAGAAPELIAQGGGILVGSEDVDGMAEAILRIAHMQEAQWKAMSDLAYATAHRSTWEDAAAEFERVLLEIHGRGAQAA